MTKNSITERIREYYCVGDTNEWLVEKGKVKEGRLLKEVCETLEDLIKQHDELSNKYNDLSYKTFLDKDAIIKPYREDIDKLKNRLNTISSYIKSIEFKNKDSLNLIGSIVKEIKKK